MIQKDKKITHFLSSIFLIFMLINLKISKNDFNTANRISKSSTTNIPKYFKTTKVAEFLNETIGKGKTNKETAELLNISPSTINRYKKAIGITSNRKQVNRTTERKQAFMLKSMKTKATNKLIK